MGCTMLFDDDDDDYLISFYFYMLDFIKDVF